MIYEMSAEERLGMFVGLRREFGLNLLYTGTIPTRADTGEIMDCRIFFPVSDYVAERAVSIMQDESVIEMEIEAEMAEREAMRAAARAPVRNVPIQ